MKLELLSQPYRESTFTGQTFLTTAFEDEAIRRVLVLSAWARTSGIELLVPSLDALRSRGGTARLVVGVDLQGTSWQGIALARRHFNEVYVVHDPSGGTFHPKIYLAVGEAIGYALIGSNNLTAGGLWHNYEAAVTAIFNPHREPALLEGIQAYAKRLVADRAICKRVTERTYNQLIMEGWLTDETRDRRRSEDRPSRSPRRRPGQAPPLFTPSGVEKRDRPAPVRQSPSRQRLAGRTRRRLATAPDSWWKRLGAGDAQHPASGNRTGNVALTDVPTGADRARFFRDTFFGAEEWHSTGDDQGRQTDLATITADVEIGTMNLGPYALTVVFREYRRQRGRATTVLRWEGLLPELATRDVTGWYLLVERGHLGAYRLRLTPHQPA